MRRLTFTHDDLFAVATDERGRTYRVLLAAGGGAHYKLQPWSPEGKATSYRGKYITEADPLYQAIAAAEAERRARPRPPLTESQRRRFDAEVI